MTAAPIVLVPGFWLGAWAWDEVAAALRANPHVLVVVPDALTPHAAADAWLTPGEKRTPETQTRKAGADEANKPTPT